MVSRAANQNWLEFTLRCAVDYKERRITKDRLSLRILEEIDQAGDKVGIAAATLNIGKVAPLEVRLTPSSADMPPRLEWLNLAVVPFSRTVSGRRAPPQNNSHSVVP